jgi:hypothetical protein
MPSPVGLDDAPAVFGDLGVDELAQMAFHLGQGGFLVRPHQARVADDIRSQDGGKAALNPFLGHCLRSFAGSSVSLPRIVEEPPRQDSQRLRRR